MKKFLMSLCAMLAMAGSTFADDTFSVDAVTLPATYDADVVVRFSLDNGSQCSGYQFWLKLPDKLEFKTDASGNVVYTAGDSYADAVQAVTANIDDGYLKVACNTNNSNPLTNQSGVLVVFKVKVKQGETVNVGQLFEGESGGSLTNGKISNPNGLVHDVANSEFSITITDRVVLDETSTMAPSAATGVNVQVKRTIKAGEWNTICLPFTMTKTQVEAVFGADVEIMKYTGYTAEIDMSTLIPSSLTINFEQYTMNLLMPLRAGTPYLIKTNVEGIESFNVDNVNIVTSTEDVSGVETTYGLAGKFKGTLVKTIVPNKCLFISGNKFYYSTGLTNIKAFRGWWELQAVLDEVIPVGAPVYINVGGETTKVEGLTIDQMDDNYYTLDGRLVKTPGKGVYIKNGKKVIVK